MSDPDTRIEVLEFLKEKCTLKTVLKLDKPCPYLGPSHACDDCSFDWMTVANGVLKVAKVRRASYEREREKSAEVEKKYAVLLEEASRSRSEMLKITDGILAVIRLVECTRGKEQEDVRRTLGSEDKESVQAGGGNEADSEDGVCPGEISV